MVGRFYTPVSLRRMKKWLWQRYGKMAWPLMAYAGPFKEDPEVVMAAVLENGSALKYADQFKEDREIVMAAVRRKW